MENRAVYKTGISVGQNTGIRNQIRGYEGRGDVALAPGWSGQVGRGMSGLA